MGLYTAAFFLGVWISTATESSAIMPELTCITGLGVKYRGTIAVTKTGKTCQNWSSQTPHSHKRTPENYPFGNLRENLCRNPDDTSGGPWCYTTDPDTRWESCDIPSCSPTDSSTDIPEFSCVTGLGETYRGTIAVTKTGKTCQNWSSQTPHSHKRTPENYPSGDLRENLCRNPDVYSGGPWCYTSDPDTRWELCKIPSCSPTVSAYIIPEFSCITGPGSAYRGMIAVTETGKTCQNWSSQTPHSHKRTPENYPYGGLDDNYCRNPDGEKKPWCYTTDPDTRWEYCNVLRCGDTPAPGIILVAEPGTGRGIQRPPPVGTEG